MGLFVKQKSSYSQSRPNKKTIKIINKLYKQNKIIIFTSRYMGRNNENTKKAKDQGYPGYINNLKLGSKLS